MPINQNRYQQYRKELRRILAPLTFQEQAATVQTTLLDYLSRNTINPEDVHRLTRIIRQLFNDEFEPFVAQTFAAFLETIDVINDLYTDLSDIDITRDFQRIRAIEQVNREQLGEFSQASIIRIQRAVRESLINQESARQLQRRITPISQKTAFYARTIAQTHVKTYSRILKHEKAQLAAVVYYEYVGIIRATTREFCAERVGNTFHINDILAMQNGNREPVIENCGGWNCIHDWEPDPFFQP